MWPKRFLLLGFFIINLVLVTACESIGTPKTAKIAISLPLGLDFGVDMVNAAKLAVENADGKAGDVNIELVVFDVSDPNSTPISAEFEKRNAETVVNDLSFVGYIGPLSSNSAKISIPILNQVSLALISPSATWPGLTKPGYGPGEPGIYYPTGNRNFFRTVPSDEAQAAAAAHWCLELGFTRIFIANGNDPYGVGLQGLFERTAQDVGLEIVGQETFESTELLPEAELLSIANRVLETNPDMVYIGGGVGSNADRLVGLLRESSPTLPIMGPDALVQDELIEIVGGSEAARDIYGTTVALPADQLGTAEADKFVEDYQAAYGKVPSAYVAATYEAAGVLLYAIANAEEPTRESVLEAMQNLGDYSGIFGTWHFSEQGDISASGISGMQIQNGEWVFVQALK